MATSHPLEGAYERPAAARASERASASISIVMPCLNEEQTVEIVRTKALSWLERSPYTGEVVVVDNGSTDRSAELAAAAGARVVHEPRPATAPRSAAASPRARATGS